MTASLPKLLEERRDLIACPRCRGRLDLAQQVFLCTSCGEAYAVEQGLPRLFWFHEDAGADDVTEIVKAFYERTPFPNYDDIESAASLQAKVGAGNFARMLDEALPADATVLEVGCGTGQLSNYLALGGRQVFGADLCVNSLQLARGFASGNGIDSVAFVHMNLFRPAFAPGSFDFVACNGVLHHTADPYGGFQSILSLVKDDGLILVGLYNRYGRVMTNVRREVFRRGGEGLRSIDPRLRGGRYAERKAVTWYRDQYDHPHESQHSIGEVLQWFDANGVEFVSCLPSVRPGGGMLDRTARPTRAEQVRVQARMVVEDREGGFFTLVGRKRGSPAGYGAPTVRRRYRSPRPASERHAGMLGTAAFHALGLGQRLGLRAEVPATAPGSNWTPAPADTDPYEPY